METATRGKLREHAAAELRAELARQRISAAELARRLGWAQSYMARRIDGRVALDLDDLETLADALNVRIVDLLPAREPGNTLRYRNVSERVGDRVPRPPGRTDMRGPSSTRPRMIPRPPAQSPRPQDLDLIHLRDVA